MMRPLFCCVCNSCAFLWIMRGTDKWGHKIESALKPRVGQTEMDFSKNTLQRIRLGFILRIFFLLLIFFWWRRSELLDTTEFFVYPKINNYLAVGSRCGRICLPSKQDEVNLFHGCAHIYLLFILNEPKMLCISYSIVQSVICNSHVFFKRMPNAHLTRTQKG